MSRFGRDGRGPWRDEPPVDIRVTDRRRIQLDDETGETQTANVEAPNLKPKYVEELEARTYAAEQKIQEVQARFEQLRKQLQSETDETRQRLNKAADERAHREKANFIAALLPVLDNLQRATEAGESGAVIEDVVAGVRQTATSFENALASAGVEPVNAVGQKFDPQLHEAVETAEVGADDEGKVVEEYSRGYRIGDRLLRPARVKVGRHSQKASGAVE
ncbi:MAG TPA: nucleotide exchange factor GrpE [Pyrinomonadaceae bacterium]|nr:nucleotide exchange factor GrpE [Pyrinomonadaceae bacterium]